MRNIHLKNIGGLLVVLFMNVIAFAQLDTKHYIPPVHARSASGSHYLVLGTPIATTFNVTVTDGYGNLIATIPISNGASSTSLIGTNYNSPFLVTESQLNTPYYGGKGLILTAPEPFYASIRVLVTNQAGSLTSKGESASLGKDFRIGHMYNNAGASSVKSSSFSIMATEDNTNIAISDIHAGVVLRGVAANTTNLNITLNAGQSYVVSTYMDQAGSSNNANGLNGTHVTSDKNIAINCASWLGGNSINGTSPSGSADTGKDIGIDQIVPIDVIGDEYVLIKGFGIDNERTVIIASEDNTELFINGGTSIGTIDAGDYHVLDGTSFSTNDNLYLTASAPVYVTQTTNGGSGTSSDNEHQAGMNFIPPVKCTGDQWVTVPNVTFIGQAYINIVADAGAVITANGNLINGATAIPGTSDYVTYSIYGYTGDVNLESTLPIRVSLINLNGNVGAAGYFSGFSKVVSMDATYLNNGLSSNDEIAEGCGTGVITIERLSIHANSAVTINLSTSGSAQEGIDYSAIPSQVTMAAGQTQVSFSIDALADQYPEGVEDVIISLAVQGNYCLEDEITFHIYELPELMAVTQDYTLNCPGDSVTLDVTVSGGLSPYIYDWSTGSVNETITVAPTSTSNYSVSITDVCGIDTLDQTITVSVPSEPLVVYAGADQTVLCPYTDITLVAESFGGNPGYSYVWTTNSSILGHDQTVEVSAPTTTSYVVEISDACGVMTYDTVQIVVTTPLMELEVNEDRLICPLEETELWVNVSGGLPPFTYLWSHSGETDSNVWVNPAVSTTYEVVVSDACNTYDLTGYPFVEVVQPIADFEFLSNVHVEGLAVYFENTSVGGVAWEWDLGNGDYSDLFSPGTTYDSEGTYIVTLIATNEMGCTDTISKPMEIDPEFWFYAPNAFTPDGNEFNNSYTVSVIGATEFNFKIFNRWGEIVFETNDPAFNWDGTYNGQMAQDNVYVYVAVILTENDEVKKYTGHISLLK